MTVPSFIQRMLLQEPAEEILILPAWPKHWNVFFKLHANYQTTVIGEWSEGRITTLTVNPASRKKAIKVMAEQEPAVKN